MNVIYTDESLEGLEESLSFFRNEVELPEEMISELVTRLFDKVESLVEHPLSYQKEINLSGLDKDYRRALEGEFKIVYYIQDQSIYITDFFYTHMNPGKMRG